MKILLLTQWFEPEPCFKGLAFAKELQRQGHHVSVLTGYPNYPSGEIYPGYRQRWRRHEMIDGIGITRMPLYPSHDRSPARRMLNYISFALSSLLGTLLAPRPDLVYAYSPPPSAALGAVALKLLRKTPFVLDIQDLWPDALGATGMVRAPMLLGLIEWWVDFIQRHAAHIVVLSNGFQRTLIARGVPADRISVIPNWTNEDSGGSDGHRAVATTETFDILFAGNIGPAQDLGAVLEAAALLVRSAPNVRFLIVGDGVDAEALQISAQRLSLTNVAFLGRLPPGDMPRLFATAQALLVHLRDDPAFSIAIPSKTQAYLRAGKPILMGARGDAAELVDRAGAGLSFQPGDPAALAEAVLRLIAMPEAERTAMGHAGAEYYRDHLSLEVGTKAFARVFEQALADSRR